MTVTSRPSTTSPKKRGVVVLVRRAVLLGLVVITTAGAADVLMRPEGAASGGWRADAPGVVHHITSADLPAPMATAIGVSPSAIAPRPAAAILKTPPGFSVSAFAKLDHPRQIHTAPNGDIFVAETDAGQISVLRAVPGATTASVNQVFVAGLDRPFGIAFYPAGPNPKWVYVANNNAVVRFAYQAGDLKARGGPETVVAKLADTSGGHSTRDIVFTAEGDAMLVSVGSDTNIADGMPRKSPEDLAAWNAAHAMGAAWGKETDRADLLRFSPQGAPRGVAATGLRNCVSLAINPVRGDPWCVVNERDLLGDDLPPDYATRVKPKAFYGWPWYYIGAHEDPRLKGQRPDLAGKVTVPDVLLQSHSAPLGIAFYSARGGPAAFPAQYRGDAFVALHGSWNRAKRTGYKVVRLKLERGVPTGTYEDFLTGFVIDDRSVWGRPVGVAVANDGALLVTDDAGDTVWRVAYGAPGAGSK